VSKATPGRFGRLVQRIDKDPRLVKLPKGLKVYAAEPS
jgi:hypothetical protein